MAKRKDLLFRDAEVQAREFQIKPLQLQSGDITRWNNTVNE